MSASTARPPTYPRVARLLDAFNEARDRRPDDHQKMRRLGMVMALLAGTSIVQALRGRAMIETLLGSLLGRAFRLAPEV